MARVVNKSKPQNKNNNQQPKKNNNQQPVKETETVNQISPKEANIYGIITNIILVIILGFLIYFLVGSLRVDTTYKYYEPQEKLKEAELIHYLPDQSIVNDEYNDDTIIIFYNKNLEVYNDLTITSNYIKDDLFGKITNYLNTWKDKGYNVIVMDVTELSVELSLFNEQLTITNTSLLVVKVNDGNVDSQVNFSNRGVIPSLAEL